MNVINFLGGRKNMIGYVFLGCTTFLARGECLKADPDYVGLTSVIVAIATGVGALVWGNVKEHQASVANQVQP
jgi:hypothetical protein